MQFTAGRGVQAGCIHHRDTFTQQLATVFSHHSGQQQFSGLSGAPVKCDATTADAAAARAVVVWRSAVKH
jgi:hypothetical protein